MKFCTNPPCSFGENISDKGRFLSAARWYGNTFVKCEADGLRVADEAEANRIGLERGYLQRYFARPAGFIHLRLSPRTRRFLRSLKTWKARKAALLRLLDDGKSQTYLRSVLNHSCFAKQRAQWQQYIDGANPEKHLFPKFRAN